MTVMAPVTRKERWNMPLPNEKNENRHTIEEIYALPDGKRAELINGVIYDMAPPSRIHQRIVTQISSFINQYIETAGGRCEVYVAPFAVFPGAGKKTEDTGADMTNSGDTYVEPDISVICDPEKLSDRGCEGAPDWVIEVVSGSSIERDYFIKLMKYRETGVRSYWIVDPAKRVVRVYDFMNGDETRDYFFEEKIPAAIYPGFGIRIADYV